MGGDHPAMTHQVVITVIDGSGPIHGRIGAVDGPDTSFTGWLELLSCLDHLLREVRGVVPALSTAE